uniref:Uncharacterized protein n=1 Tax=Glossina brevipalpis TaxID=37001 RepID=A0A1A9WYF8_9MUSC
MRKLYFTLKNKFEALRMGCFEGLNVRSYEGMQVRRFADMKVRSMKKARMYEDYEKLCWFYVRECEDMKREPMKNRSCQKSTSKISSIKKVTFDATDASEHNHNTRVWLMIA